MEEDDQVHATLYYRAGEAWCIIECDFSLLVEGIISILQVE